MDGLPFSRTELWGCLSFLCSVLHIPAWRCQGMSWEPWSPINFQPKCDQPLLSTHLPQVPVAASVVNKEQRFHTLILYFLTYTVKNKKIQSLFSSCKAHVVFTPFFLPEQDCLFCCPAFWEWSLAEWHPLKLCCLRKHQHRVESHPGCTGWLTRPEGSSWGCLGTSDGNHSVGWHSWTSSGMHRHGLAMSWGLEQVLAVCSLCWPFNEEIFIN